MEPLKDSYSGSIVVCDSGKHQGLRAAALACVRYYIPLTISLTDCICYLRE